MGAAVVRALHRQGARVAFTYHQGEDVARGLTDELPGTHAIRTELGEFAGATAAVRSGVDQLGGLDALVQCAGTAGDPEVYRQAYRGSNQRLFRITQENFRRMWAVTVESTLAACQEAVRSLEEHGGNIVVVGSMDGDKPLPGPVHYATVKGALRSLVESLAKEVGEDGVCVNLVAPGLLDGGMARYVGPEFLDAYLEHCSLGRTGTSDEIAEVVAWLALENTYVTAQTILLDGGL